MSNLFNFLSNQALASNAEVKPVNRAIRPSVSRNPTDADIRIFKNGAVYPSLALIERDQLAYLPKGEDGIAFGYDIVDSRKFLNTQAWETPVVFIARVPKTAAKVDLFGRTAYAEDGTPGDVATQGATTYGKDMLVTLKEVYGVEIPENENYIDLKIVENFPFTTNDGIYFLPKVVARGDNKGQLDLIRRENITLFPIMPVSLLQEQGSVQETEGEVMDAAAIAEFQEEEAREIERARVDEDYNFDDYTEVIEEEEEEEEEDEFANLQ